MTQRVDGRLLAGSGREGVHVWDAASGREIARFALERPAHDVDDDKVTALAFDHHGRFLAVGQEDGRLSLFDVAEEKWMGDLPMPTGCFGNSCATLSLDFSASGDRLAAVVGENILIWKLDPRLWVQQARQLANRSLSDTERRRYLPRD